MIKTEYEVKKINGINSKLCMDLVAISSKYKASIILYKDKETANLKSIINTISLVIPEGSEISIEIEGDDEVEAAKKIEQLLTQNNILKIS